MNDNIEIKIGDFGLSKYLGDNKEYIKIVKNQALKIIVHLK